METNIPVWLGRKKKFESSIEFQAYFLDTIASMMISESLEERKTCQVETVGIRARNFRKQLRDSGVSYQDYQTGIFVSTQESLNSCRRMMFSW